MLASGNGHVETMQVLIEKGSSLEAAENVRIHSHACLRTHNPVKSNVAEKCNLI